MASNDRFWRFVIAVQNKYRQGVFDAIREQINYFADSYKPGDVPTFLPTKDLTKVLRRLHEDAGLNNALYVHKQIKRQIKKSEDNLEEILKWDLNEYFRQYLLQNAVLPITETTRKQINQVLLQGDAQGWGAKKMVAALKNTDITKQRAELIVRTESIKGANAGAMFAAAQMGIVLNKQWISAQDNRTRRIPRDQYDHLHMNKQIVGFSDAFIVPSTKTIDAMQYPGDPSGSAGNVCNCFLPQELTSVNPKHIKKVFRSVYDGDVITIQCTNGNSFTCTPNHPILTTIGWKPSAMLNESDYLVNSSFIQDTFCPNFNVNNSITTFEQIYDTLFSVGHIMRKAGVNMDFYGDGSTSNVDIVSMESLLHFRPIHFQSIKNRLLKHSNFAKRNLFSFCGFNKSICSLFFSRISHSIISTFYKFFPTFNIGLAHSQIHGFTSIPSIDTDSFQSIRNNISGTPKMIGKSFDAETGIIKGFDFSDGNNCSRISKISVSHYKGFVYTFETINQMYDINSLVAKNCRCTVAFVPVRDANGRVIPLSKTMVNASPFTQIAEEGSRLFIDNTLRLGVSLLLADLIAEIEKEDE